MLPKVALLGRPNVGKSTLFNRMIRSNRAITHDRPGVTRDRMEGLVHTRNGKAFKLIDTGGVTLDHHAVVAEGPEGMRGFEPEILRQAEAAMGEAAVFCLVVDGRDGLTPFDEHLAGHLRRLGKPVLLVINKVDGLEREDELSAEFHGLGFPLLCVSAEHGHNVRALEDELADLLPPPDPDEPEDESPETAPIRLAMLGRPNAGKSSLVNAMSGGERMIVSDAPGTTRDSVDVPFERKGVPGVFVDTAGVRRRTRISDTVERFSVNAAIKSTTKADVTLFVIDAPEGVTSQDKRLIDLLDERKTPFIILANKIDLVGRKERSALDKDFKEALQFCTHVPVLQISAQTGIGLDAILPIAERIREECQLRVSTGRLNRAMEEVLGAHQPPVVRRSRPKFFYLTQAEIAPPTFVFFVSDSDRVADSYVRYLEKSLRRLLGIEHAPMRVHLRSSHTKRDGTSRKDAFAKKAIEGKEGAVNRKDADGGKGAVQRKNAEERKDAAVGKDPADNNGMVDRKAPVDRKDAGDKKSSPARKDAGDRKSTPDKKGDRKGSGDRKESGERKGSGDKKSVPEKKGPVDRKDSGTRKGGPDRRGAPDRRGGSDRKGSGDKRGSAGRKGGSGRGR